MDIGFHRPLVKKIRTESGFYLFDTRSSRLLRVTPEMFEIIDSFEKVDEVSTLGPESGEMEKIREARSKLSKLSEESGLFCPGPLKRRACSICRQDVRTALSNGSYALSLEIADSCNLRCEYCIFSGGYVQYKSHGVRKMTMDVARAGIDFYLSSRGKTAELNIGFYGGEPLLNFDGIFEVCDYVKKKVSRESEERPLLFNITTNGTLLDDEKINWLIANQVAITISCDGPAQIHDRHRVFPNGRGSFDIVFPKLQTIYDRNPDYYKNNVTISCSVCPCSNLMEIRDFFEKYQYLFGRKTIAGMLAFGNPTYEAKHLPYNGREEDVRKLRGEYITAHLLGNTGTDAFQDSFTRIWHEKTFLSIYKRAIRSWPSNELDEMSTCFPGSRKLFVDIDGMLHICERVPRFFPIGDVWNGYDFAKIEQIFNDFAHLMNSETCKRCWGIPFCNKCFMVGFDGGFPERILESCPGNLGGVESALVDYCTIMEQNPTAFDYMKDIIAR